MSNKNTKKSENYRSNLIHKLNYQLDPFTLTDDGLFINQLDKRTQKETTLKVSEALFIEKIVQNLDTKDVKVHLCYKFNKKYHVIEVGMGQLIPTELLKLSAKGVDVSHENVKHIASFLRMQQKIAPHYEIYKEVGWHYEDQKLIFRHHKVLSTDHTLLAMNDTEEGIYNLEPAGTLDAWRDMVEKETRNNVMLQFLLALGFSSAIIGYLTRHYDDVDTLLVHLAGNSTQGKTTGALLFASVFGLPSNRNKGLQRTWNGTTNATINMMGGNYGIPVVLDELSMNNAHSLTSELYVLTSGQEKQRLTENIVQRKTNTWGTTILSTGEKSIFELTNNNAGLLVRVLEFSDVAWTSSAKNADAIRRVIQDNYGHAGITFVNYLFEQGLEKIEGSWQQWTEILEDKLPESPFQSRIAKKYAIILTAGDLANEALSLSLNLEDIITYLVADEKEKIANRDLGAKARNYIIQLVSQYQSNFRRDDRYTNPLNCWGKIFNRTTFYEIAILKNVLFEQLRNGGFEDPRVVIRELRENNWLITESDRTTKRTKIFEETEQERRKKALGSSNLPKALSDTTYNIKIPLESLDGFLYENHHVLMDE